MLTYSSSMIEKRTRKQKERRNKNQKSQ